jgi:hypothetical protein
VICASDWRAMQRTVRRGFVTLHLEPSGLVLRDCLEWIGLPSKPQINRDGNHRQNLKTGKPAYVAIVEIPDKDRRDRFQAAAVAVVHALLGEAAP